MFVHTLRTESNIYILTCLNQNATNFFTLIFIFSSFLFTVFSTMCIYSFLFGRIV